MKKPTIVEHNLPNDYTVGTSYANIGAEIIIPEDGYYLVFYTATGDVVDTDDTAAALYVRLALKKLGLSDFNGIPSTQVYAYHSDGANNNRIILQNANYCHGFYKKGDHIQMQAYMAAGDNCTIKATNAASQYSTKVTAIKLT